MSINLRNSFHDLFGVEAEAVFFCPGRINLIGEHIDYNGGNVMPCAISLGTWLAIRPNDQQVLRFRCLNFPEQADIPLQPSYAKSGREWYNYPLGIIDDLVRQGYTLPGMDLLFYGDLPIGAGLSSSASVEVLTAFAFNLRFHLGISRQDLALLAQKVEIEFIGLKCGIMDQFAVAMGKENQAMKLNCATLEHQYLPVHLKEHTLVIINSNKQRSLSESKYNERFSECMEATAIFRQAPGLGQLQFLCELSMADWERLHPMLGDTVLKKRSRHVISENERVNAAAKALQEDDLEAFGQLLFASHQSLKDDFEVSGKELDAIVAFCKGFNDCVGARMTGAGFGGCAIALVKKESVEVFSNQLAAFYRQAVGYDLNLFESGIGDGVRLQSSSG